MYRRLGGGESGLAAYFPLNKGYSAATQNYVEGAAATISGASWQSDADFADSLLTGADWVIAMPQPVNDAVLALDGVDDYMDCGAIDFAQGEYTLEAWFKTSRSTVRPSPSGNRQSSTTRSISGDICSTALAIVVASRTA
jgi:hypothetical protein